MDEEKVQAKDCKKRGGGGSGIAGGAYFVLNELMEIEMGRYIRTISFTWTHHTRESVIPERSVWNSGQCSWLTTTHLEKLGRTLRSLCTVVQPLFVLYDII